MVKSIQGILGIERGYKIALVVTVCLLATNAYLAAIAGILTFIFASYVFKNSAPE